MTDDTTGEAASDKGVLLDHSCTTPRRFPLPAWMLVAAVLIGLSSGLLFWRTTKWADIEGETSVAIQCAQSIIVGILATIVALAVLGIVRWLQVGGREEEIKDEKQAIQNGITKGGSRPV